MKKQIVTLTLALTLVALALWGVGGCIGESVTGSGNLLTESYDFRDFSRIEAHSGFEIEVTRADTFILFQVLATPLECAYPSQQQTGVL